MQSSFGNIPLLMVNWAQDSAGVGWTQNRWERFTMYRVLCTESTVSQGCSFCVLMYKM